MLAKNKAVLVFCGSILLQLFGTACARCFAQRSKSRSSNPTLLREESALPTPALPAANPWREQAQPSPLNEDPDALLKQAAHVADLYNWADAAPFFERAEDLYKARGDDRNALYAHFGKLRSTMEQLALTEVSDELGAELNSNPLLQSDRQLRLFCLIVKGDIDGEIDATPMRLHWEEALQIATELGDAKWKNRSS